MDQSHKVGNEKPLTPFQKLQVSLSQTIENTPAGEKLPSEPKLAKQLGVSRATLREAMRSFEGKGVIRRRQGVGTFVISPSQVIETGLEMLESLESLSSKLGLDVTMGDLNIEYKNADAFHMERLGIEADSRIVSISRVILIEDHPVAYLIDTLPEDIFSEEDLQTGFTGSVLDRLIVSNKYNLSKSKTFIHAIAAPSQIARALQIQRGDVLLLFEAYLYDDSNSVIDFSYSYFLPGYFRFQVMRSVGD